MGGHLLVLLAMGLHLRYVLADARGLLPPRPAKAAKLIVKRGSPKRSATGTATDDTWVAVDSPHGSPQPVLRRASVVAATAPVVSAPPAAAPAQTKLSKAERKALKNRLIQEQLKRRQQADGAWGG